MKKQRTLLELAAGKLIVAVQQQWHLEAGEPGDAVSEQAMHKCHDLLSASKTETHEQLLRGGSVADFIGRAWVRAHPGVSAAIEAYEKQRALR